MVGFAGQGKSSLKNNRRIQNRLKKSFSIKEYDVQKGRPTHEMPQNQLLKAEKKLRYREIIPITIIVFIALLLVGLGWKYFM